ncbi:MAG: hypothetical protein ACLSAH_10145 [Bilophila wadsworthia]
MVDKGKLESSGCLGGGNDHFIAVLNTDEPQDTIDDLVKAYLAEQRLFGKADPRLGRSHARHGGLPRRRRGEAAPQPGRQLPAHGGRGEPAWYINIADGQMIKRLIARKIRSMGADVLDHVMITKLLKRTGGWSAAGTTCSTAPSTPSAAGVIALGNSCNRATANSTGNPYNTWHSPSIPAASSCWPTKPGRTSSTWTSSNRPRSSPRAFGCAGMNGIKALARTSSTPSASGSWAATIP